MTVCIAAVSIPLTQIITVSDTKLAIGYSSIKDATTKARFLTKDCRWVCMYAGIAPAFESIYDRLGDILHGHDNVSSTFVKAAVETAYRDELRHMAEIRLFSPFAIDLPTFEQKGFSQFGSKVFNVLHKQIIALNTGVDLLVCGFERNDYPRIFSASGRGEVFDCATLGFDAIGTGAGLAVDWLNGNDEFRRCSDIGEIIYRLCEAKFTAESNPDVGDSTFVCSVDINGTSTQLDDRALEDARRLWKRRRTAGVPERILAGLRGGASFDKNGDAL